jgi:endonuclease/exonuclease/phosphatase family metal-dependent hydrolase
MSNNFKKSILGSLFIIIIATVLFFIFVTVFDYKPDLVESVEVLGSGSQELSQGDSIEISTWNIGYAGLGASEDFFMDDGTNSRPKEKRIVEEYLKGILETLENFDTDITMLQEVDIHSKRSYYLNQLDELSAIKQDEAYSFAKNYDVKFVPVPFPPLGSVRSGIATFSEYDIEDSTRYAFEGNYAWPKSTVMLDRCYMVSTVPLAGTDQKLVLVNAHFSAYDDGSLRASQLGAIKEFMLKAYEENNYVIIGGDWNQTFEFIDTDAFPIYKEGAFYLPSIIENEWLPDGWQWAIDEKIPTYRLLNSEYVEGETQVGIIDGFLVSPNVEIKNIETLDLKFKNSDHNPVIATFRLKK